MGINHGAQVFYSIKSLRIGDVADVGKGLVLELGTETPIILDMDCSNVCFKVGKNVQSLVSFLMQWANTGLCIVPVCDAKACPISKQATNKRKTERDKKKIEASILHKEIHELGHRLYKMMYTPPARDPS